MNILKNKYKGKKKKSPKYYLLVVVIIQWKMTNPMEKCRTIYCQKVKLFHFIENGFRIFIKLLTSEYMEVYVLPQYKTDDIKNIIYKKKRIPVDSHRLVLLQESNLKMAIQLNLIM